MGRTGGDRLGDRRRHAPLDLELEDRALCLHPVAEGASLADHPADEDADEGADDDRRNAEPRREPPDRPERRQRYRADEDAEDAAADRAADADRVRFPQELVGEALDDLGVVTGRRRHLLVIGGPRPDLERNRPTLRKTVVE